MSNNPLIQTQDLKKTYTTGDIETPALCGVSVELHKGEFTAVAGPSGSGKSTLLHLLGGLDRPTEGEIFLEGQAMSGLSKDQLAKLRTAAQRQVMKDRRPELYGELTRMI